jgi:RNA polymerase sigma-70 factor (ECF subfamily)
LIIKNYTISISTLEFNQLILVNSDFLSPFANTLTRDKESAKDLVQETLYKVIGNREIYRSGTNIKAWLYTIMRNIFINAYRKKARHQVVFDATPNNFLMDSNQSAISNRAESILQMKEIESAIHYLPSIFKEPFILYFEGYKYNEIADILNEPLGAIKSRIHFARKLLKEKLSRF